MPARWFCIPTAIWKAHTTRARMAARRGYKTNRIGLAPNGRIPPFARDTFLLSIASLGYPNHFVFGIGVRGREHRHGHPGNADVLAVLVSRFRSSHDQAAIPSANFGIKGTLADLLI